jgi:hypothetical protein
MQARFGILRNNVTRFVITQTGSRHLQSMLQKSTPELIEFLLQEVNQDMAKIMKNQYGNYFF